MMRENYSLPSSHPTYVFGYLDDEGDKITITTPLGKFLYCVPHPEEWDTMFTHSWWDSYILQVAVYEAGKPIFPQQTVKQESISLPGNVFVTWIKSHGEWKRYYLLAFNQYGIVCTATRFLCADTAARPKQQDYRHNTGQQKFVKRDAEG
jgi:hypothetical protein